MLAFGVGDIDHGVSALPELRRRYGELLAPEAENPANLFHLFSSIDDFLVLSVYILT